ncbi:MAG: SIR2 family protein [Magnetococcus sp. YQC-5]
MIGFSGDDPNFLHWSGWVRDHLEVLTQKIYLVGWMDLSPHRRRMLEERHVVPIDMAHLPVGKSWPLGHRHRYATEWFLHMLHLGRPLSSDFWTRPGDSPRQPPEYLKIPASSATPCPMEEASSPSHLTNGDTRLEAVRKTINGWAYNRTCYPNWLVAPEHVRSTVWRYTDRWILEVLYPHPGMMPWERLFFLEELVWRLNTALAPIFDEVVQEIFAILDSVDVQQQICHDSKKVTVEWPNPDWIRARRCWRELALAVVRSYRDKADLKTASNWLDKLAPFLSDEPEFGNKVVYEHCLVALSRLDHKELKQLIDAWNTGRSDPFWDVRKAALLGETNDVDQALSIIRSSIKTIRRNTRKGDIDLPSLSREGWALYNLMAFKYATRFSINTRNYFDYHEQNDVIHQRWKELAVYHCDASADYNALLGKLEKDPPTPLTSGVVQERMFDLGEIRETHHFRSLGIEESGLLVPYQMKRLIEIAGLPSKVNYVKIAANALNLCALRFLHYNKFEIAVQLGWRVADYYNDKNFKNIFSRTTIAHLNDQFVQAMMNDLLKLADYSYIKCNYHDGSERSYWVTRLRNAIEILSMLTPRLPVQDVNALLDRANRYYQSDLFRRDPWLTTELAHLFKRTLKALPISERYRHAPILAALPIPGRFGFSVADENHWPDPYDFWPETPHPPALSAPQGEIEKIVEELLSAMAEEQTRERASFRLVWLYDLGLMSSQKQSLFARTLWDERFRTQKGLPGKTSLSDWVFLRMPEPNDGDAERAFRSAYLDTKPDTPTEIQNSLVMLSMAIRYEKPTRRPFTLSQEDEVFINELIRCWVSTGLKFPSSPNPIVVNQIMQTLKDLEDIGFLVSAFKIPEITAKDLLDAVQSGMQDYPELLYLFPGLLRSIPEQVKQAQISLAHLMASDLEKQVRIATRILFDWSRNVQRFPADWPSPPLDLIREVGTIIRIRRKATLRPALTFAIWSFQKGPEEWWTKLADDCIHGLTFLLKEASYHRSDPQSVTDDLPFLRYQCVMLSIAMSKTTKFKDAEPIKQWLENASDDPMTEVRNAVSEYGNGPSA